MRRICLGTMVGVTLVGTGARASTPPLPPPPQVPVQPTAPGEAPPPGTLLSDDTFDFEAGGDLVLDAGLVIALPAALPTGMSVGIGAGFAMRRGDHFAFGARLEGVTATESSMTWTVTDRELRARATAAAVTRAGRADLAIRAALGGDLVHETRDRNQGKRAGLTGSDLEQTALELAPALDVALVVELHVAGHWLLDLAGGPTVDLVNGGTVHPGWTTQLGVGWRP